MRRLVLVALLALAGCGGDGDSVPTVDGLAGRLGCTELVIESDATQRELGAREQGSCRLGGETVTILTYNTTAARDGADEIARHFGGIAVLGDRWTVRADTDATARQVQAALGGTLG